MLIHRVRLFIKEQNLLQPHSTLIVGLSGGPDSVFLLHALKALQEEYSLTLIVAHLDHQWRPDSHKDALFCQQLARDLALSCIVQTASEMPIAKKPTGSQEALGRQLRRAFFEQLAHEYSAQAIALAHHADDQQETFFIRLLRGATISGLASIRPSHNNYIRPLLSITKEEILAYLHEHALDYLVDPTNKHNTYLRNKIRNQIVPLLKLADCRFEKNCIKTIAHIQETDNFLNRLTSTTFSAITHTDNSTVILNIPAFLACDEFLQPRLLLMWLCSMKVPFNPSTGLFNEIISFLKHTTSGTHTLYGSWSIIKKKNNAFITIKARV